MISLFINWWQLLLMGRWQWVVCAMKSAIQGITGIKWAQRCLWRPTSSCLYLVVKSWQSAALICWLAAGDKEFSVNKEHKELSDNVWLLDLGSQTDVMAKLNTLNNELQGKDRHLPHMINSVFRTHIQRLECWLTFPIQRKCHRLSKTRMFFTLSSTCVHLDKVETEFSQRFGELDFIEDFGAFVSNPSLSTDTV